jgi:putative PIN family toxin of toxin-antitoxin system
MPMKNVTRVVLDTNVLVAVAYNPSSASRQVVEACLKGELAPVWSPSLRREYEFILARAARGQTYLERINHLLAHGEVIEPARTPQVVPKDPDDDKLVAAALAAGAVLVPHDAPLLAVAGHEGLRVVRPADLRAG